MTFDVELDNRARSISVRHSDRPDRYDIMIDGRSFKVHARRTGGNGLTILTVISAQQAAADAADKTNGANDFWGRAPRRIFLTSGGPAGEVMATFDGRTSVVTLNGRQSRPAMDRTAPAHGDQSVRAPMPGRVVRVLVAPGDQVTAGQGVIVVEAMKMENELRAPKAGRVKDVRVSAGTLVDAGKVLIVFE
jgi:biotin carboxyl carrier protein